MMTLSEKAKFVVALVRANEARIRADAISTHLRLVAQGAKKTLQDDYDRSDSNYMCRMCDPYPTDALQREHKVAQEKLSEAVALTTYTIERFLDNGC